MCIRTRGEALTFLFQVVSSLSLLFIVDDCVPSVFVWAIQCDASTRLPPMLLSPPQQTKQTVQLDIMGSSFFIHLPFHKEIREGKTF
jgi:hypothetical protein